MLHISGTALVLEYKDAVELIIGGGLWRFSMRGCPAGIRDGDKITIKMWKEKKNEKE